MIEPPKIRFRDSLHWWERRHRNDAAKKNGWGGCGCCGDTWNWKMSHPTAYSASGACFPLCEECWGELWPCERVEYYRELGELWARNWRDRGGPLGDDTKRDAPQVLERACLAEEDSCLLTSGGPWHPWDRRLLENRS